MVNDFNQCSPCWLTLAMYNDVNFFKKYFYFLLFLRFLLQLLLLLLLPASFFFPCTAASFFFFFCAWLLCSHGGCAPPKEKKKKLQRKKKIYFFKINIKGIFGIIIRVQTLFLRSMSVNTVNVTSWGCVEFLTNFIGNINFQ